MSVEVLDKRLQATHHLDWYIPNELTWEDPWGPREKTDKEKLESPWKETKVSGLGEQILINALRDIVQDKTGRGIILLASRGSGKTVASYRCEHLLANASTSREIFSGSRPLVFRWAKANWPTTTADNLIDLVAADSKLKEFLKNKSGLRDVSQLCRSVAEYAFDEERLVIIVDAYDELDDKQKDSLRAVHAQALEDTKKVLWIITSRDYVVNEEKETFFKEDVFRRIRLQPFSRELQNQFMERSLSPMVRSWREACFKDSGEDWDKQLGTPLTLRQVAVMINESTSTESQMPSFSSLSDLFVQSSDLLIDREFVERNLSQEKSRIDGRSLTPPLRREYIERALGAIAFELAVRRIWKEVIGTTDRITKVIGNAKERYLLGCKESMLGARHNSESSWDWAYARIGEFETNNSAFQADINKEVLSFPTRHVQEMRCARYLSKYATANDLRDAAKRDRCALGHNGDESWTDIWKGIIKMPVDASSDNESGRYFEALKVLFERPTQVDQRRPTQLMWEAYQWVKQRNAKIGSKLREHLRGQFLKILNGLDCKEKEIARDLIDLSNFVVLADPQDKRDEFDTGSFRRGKQEVHLSRYLLCKYAVSNEQYWLFDNNFVGRDIQGRAGGFNHSLQPAVYVSWSDAYWYCEFVEIGLKELRMALTTEAQWEYAARSGSTGDYFRNHEGQDVKKQDLADYAQFGQAASEGRTLPVKGHGKYPNAWGLEMMAGNVLEWCCDWYGEYPEDAVLTDPFGPKEGSFRVIRGGSWYYGAANCRSANRYRFAPSDRYPDYGFRVALSSSGIPQSPEADK
jgi:hypothetical protein